MNRVQSDMYWYDLGYKTAQEQTIYEVLDIIDRVARDDTRAWELWDGVALACGEIKVAVLALKGEEE